MQTKLAKNACTVLKIQHRKNLN